MTAPCCYRSGHRSGDHDATEAVAHQMEPRLRRAVLQLDQQCVHAGLADVACAVLHGPERQLTHRHEQCVFDVVHEVVAEQSGLPAGPGLGPSRCRRRPFADRQGRREGLLVRTGRRGCAAEAEAGLCEQRLIGRLEIGRQFPIRQLSLDLVIVGCGQDGRSGRSCAASVSAIRSAYSSY